MTSTDPTVDERGPVAASLRAVPKLGIGTVGEVHPQPTCLQLRRIQRAHRAPTKVTRRAEGTARPTLFRPTKGGVEPMMRSVGSLPTGPLAWACSPALTDGRGRWWMPRPALKQLRHSWPRRQVQAGRPEGMLEQTDMGEPGVPLLLVGSMQQRALFGPMVR